MARTEPPAFGQWRRETAPRSWRDTLHQPLGSPRSPPPHLVQSLRYPRGKRPYVYGRYLQFKYLKWPLIKPSWSNFSQFLCVLVGVPPVIELVSWLFALIFGSVLVRDFHVSKWVTKISVRWDLQWTDGNHGWKSIHCKLWNQQQVWR